MANLPAGVRPRALAERFPRIANVLAAWWAQPESLKAYLDELFIDRRGGRKGFPKEVARDLVLLRAHCATLYSDSADIWREAG